jgi:hypothetical protein
MKKTLSCLIKTVILVGIVSYLGYYLLLQDNFLHLSIASIIDYSQHLALKKHLLVLAILPIYIAAVIFGTTMLGYYITLKVQSFLKIYKEHNLHL